MEIFIIEKGFCRQDGEIVAAFLKLSDAIDEFVRIRDVEEARPGNAVERGVNEYDKTPDVIFGFWSGPVPGNTHAHGWRLRGIEAK